MLPSDQPPNPRLKANVFSLVFFLWLNPLFYLGYKKDLTLQDVYRTIPADETFNLANRMESAWMEQVQKAEKKNLEKGPKSDGEKAVPSLIKALVKVFAPPMAVFGISAFVEECIFKLFQPILLGFLLEYFHDPDSYEPYYGYLFGLGVVCCGISYTTMDHPFTFAVQHLGMKMRISLCSLIYRKSLRVSKYALEQTTAGQIINFLSSDMNRFDIFFTFFHYLWVAPIQLAFVMCILYFYVEMGYASLSGLLLIFFFVPFQGYMGYMFSKLRSETAAKTDQRLLVLEEVLTAIRVIKMYTWEKPFSDAVSETRAAEVKKLKRTAMCKALNESFFSVTSRTTLFITLLTYVMTGHILTAKKVYMTLALYQTVQYLMTLFFPMAVISTAETLVALRRIHKFLLMDERRVPISAAKDLLNQRIRKYDWCLVGDNVSLNTEYTYTIASFDTTSSTYENMGVWATNISARWIPTWKEMSFSNVSFEVRGGEILAMIGPTASGKSSVLNSILYELPVEQGEFKVVGTIGYSAQEPWVFNGSVRENILFGKAYNSSWYDEVTEACALTKDFQNLAYGDRTLVGEKGTALSGGQKARVTLARAVYADADIYLLDDPLSAVDAQVGRHIMEKCILGLLKNKCRILVTHQLQHVKNVDKILLLIDGMVAHSGDYKSLQKSGIPFSDLFNPNRELLQMQQKRGDVPSLRSLREPDSISTFAVGLTDKTPGIDTNTPVIVGKTTLEEPTLAEEFVKVGKVGCKTYWRYFHSGSRACTVIFLLFLTIITQCIFTGTDLWLQFWVETENEIEEDTIVYSNNIVIRYAQEYSLCRIGIYTGLIATLFVTFFGRTQMFYSRCMKSSIVIYDRLFYGVLRSPISFFENTPIGRILNRFAKDISIIDENLPQSFYDCTEVFMQTMGVLFLVALNSPIMLVPSALLLIILFFLRKYYFCTSRDIKRLEGIARSPIFSHLSSTLNGLATIRAFGVEEKFTRNFEAIHDIHNSVWYVFLAGNRWLGITVDWITAFYTAGVTLNFLLNTEIADESAVGVSICSAMMLTSMVQWGVRQSAEMENHLIAFERVQEYCNLPSEAALDSAPDRKPPSNWPHHGEIKIQNLVLRYGENSPVAVLKNLTCTIWGGEKVGIVGRTGAGKSSLINVLFRLSEPTTGYIEIDGIETTSIGLHDLRSRISIIPQDPVIFMGTVRGNLDPFGEYTDAQIWNALQEVKLKDAVKLMNGGLDGEIYEGGSNFSAGQKQLFCLARAILKNNRILVLDEATASIDPETDRLIQKTIRRKFGDCTVLTIAHRLHTVMDSDRIIVLQAGMIMEFDEPQILLSNRNSMLYQLVQQTGKAEASQLAQMAKIAAMRRRLPVAESNSRDMNQLSRSNGSSATVLTDDIII